MNTATPFRSSDLSAADAAGTPFRAIFEHAPVAAARCNSEGAILERNSAFERALDFSRSNAGSLRLAELVPEGERTNVDLLLRELLNFQRESFTIDAMNSTDDHPGPRWTVWRESVWEGEPDGVLLLAEPSPEPVHIEETLIQTQRWEAVGRMAGGVVHDFNNLLTGVMLYCDLLLSSLDTRDRRRRYADEIRTAITQASGLVQQLLVFARPDSTPARELSLNQVASAMHELLTRLIGENIGLNLQLDPDLGAVKMDQAQAQQIVLNLVLNARDALPKGGRIIIETSNCKFQALAKSSTGGASTPSDFPCVLLAISDNGEDMNAATRQRIFEPFFTTKNAGKGTGLGLTTVRSIVTSNRGLIHFESEPGQGTRVMILLPRASHPAASCPPETVLLTSGPPSATPLHEIEKESLL